MSGSFQFPLADGETQRVRGELVTGGFLGLLLKLLGPLMNVDQATDLLVSDRRIMKRGKSGKVSSVDLSEIQKVFHNTTSDSLAVVASPGDNGLLIARIANCVAVVAALEEAGVVVEREASSPKRRFLK